MLGHSLTNDTADTTDVPRACVRASAHLADESSTLLRVERDAKPDRQENWLCPRQPAMIKFEVTGDERLARSSPKVSRTSFWRKRRCSQRLRVSSLAKSVLLNQALNKGNAKVTLQLVLTTGNLRRDDVGKVEVEEHDHVKWMRGACLDMRHQPSNTSGTPWNTVRAQPRTQLPRIPQSGHGCGSIQIELDKFLPDRDRLLSFLTCELGWDSGGTGPNDWDREEDWMRKP